MRRDIEELEFQVWTSSAVTAIDADGVNVGQARLRSGTVLWAAGVKASPLGKLAGLEVDGQGRSSRRSRSQFERGILTHFHSRRSITRFTHGDGKPLPGTAPVAMQQGRHIGRMILGDLKGIPRQPFPFCRQGADGYDWPKQSHPRDWFDQTLGIASLDCMVSSSHLLPDGLLKIACWSFFNGRRPVRLPGAAPADCRQRLAQPLS